MLPASGSSIDVITPNAFSTSVTDDVSTMSNTP